MLRVDAGSVRTTGRRVVPMPMRGWFAPWLGARARRWTVVVAAAMMVTTAAFTWSTVAVDRGEAAYDVWWDGLVYHVAAVLTVAVAVVRAVTRARARVQWCFISLGLACWTAAAAVYTFHDQYLDPAPAPMPSDVIYLAGYLAIYCGLVSGSRVANGIFGSGWLDGLVAGFGVAAICAVTVLGPIVDRAEVPLAELAWSIIYPVLDLLLIVFTIAALGPRSWRPDRSTGTLAAGLVVYAACSIVFAYQMATEDYAQGTILDAGWLVGQAVIALASMVPDRRPAEPVAARVGRVFVPLAFAGGALTVILADIWTDVPAPAIVFAVACLTVALARTALAIRDVRRLYTSHLQARTDDLTTLPNRRALIEHLDERTGRGEMVSLVLLDLDGFKDVNDMLGHEAGDELLTEIGRRLLNMSAPTSLVARLGGDEFGLVCDGGVDGALDVVALISTMFDQPVKLESMEVHVGGSSGIATSPGHAANTRDLLKCADVAMYRAKRTRSGHAVFDTLPGNDGDPSNLQLREDLRVALAAGDLRMHYQPIVDVSTGATVAAEALVRWQHPSRGLLPAGDVIAAATQIGAMRSVARHAVDDATKMIARWESMGLDLGVSVNATAEDLADEAFTDDVLDALARNGATGRRLTIEVTETSLVADDDRVHRSLRRLRTVGVQMSIDDYGAGYSSVSQLLRLEVDEIKIDRSLINAAARDSRARSIVAATAQLARALNSTVVGEGVEHAAAFDLAALIGCHRVQGFHYAPPMPAAEFERYVLSRPTGRLRPITGPSATSLITSSGQLAGALPRQRTWPRDH